NQDFSYYAQEQLLMLNDHLNVTAGITAQRSTNDGVIEQFFYYPKYAASYRIPVGGFLNELKLRAAYGRSGTEPNYGARYTNYVYAGISGANSIYPTSIALGDPNVAPETNTEIETGFDATMFNSRAQFTATVYQKRIANTLLIAGVAPSYGFAS